MEKVFKKISNMRPNRNSNGQLDFFRYIFCASTKKINLMLVAVRGI